MRLAILRELHRDPDGGMNEDLLERALKPHGFRPAVDTLRAELRRLESLGCVAVEALDDYLVPTLTDLGRDVARGRMVLDAIDRPRNVT